MDVSAVKKNPLIQLNVYLIVELIKFTIGIRTDVFVNLIYIESMDNVHYVQKVLDIENYRVTAVLVEYIKDPKIHFVSILDLHIIYLFLFV